MNVSDEFMAAEVKPKPTLPSALLKRLAKRGIIEKNKAKKLIETAEREKNDKEEIIAEDYDEIDDAVEEPNQYHEYEYRMNKPDENLWRDRIKTRMTEGGHSGYKCCPNKYNVFHKCSVFCVDRWGDGAQNPSDEYIKRKKRLLNRYPLPEGWHEVYDVGCGTHYYWNQADETVSWLPPSHPKAHISKSAGHLRRELEESVPIDMDGDGLPPQPPGVDEEIIRFPTAAPAFNSFEAVPLERSSYHPPSSKKQKSRDLDKTLMRTKNERRKRRDESDKLDPMDPAAYSDIPRGTWSSGLNNEDTKTGVDSSVSGSMFQMRPYPSPGAVLQANKKGGKGGGGNGGRHSDDEDDDNEDDYND